tara:strand:- start:5027 stop:6142 length:1116 start_codon:yes stop_codon:yes gene_type:complete
MRNALCYALLFIIISCKQEEVLVINDEQDAAFPLVLSVNDIVPGEIQLTSIKLHPSSEGGIYLAGYSSGVNISDKGQLNWQINERVFHDNNTKEVVRHDINDKDVRIFQINNIGKDQLLYSFSNDHGILGSSSLIRMGTSLYFYWRTGQPGYEQVVNIASLNSEGQLNWKKEIDFADYVYEDIVAHNGFLFVTYGDRNNLTRVNGISVTILNDSGDIVNDFELTTDLADWNIAETFVEIQADDGYIYSNTAKNDSGLLRKSRIAKYTYGGELVSEVEVLYSKDFHVVDKQVYTVGNEYEIDPDTRKGHPFVIHLDENLNVLNIRKFDNIETSWNAITVSNDVVYFYFHTYTWNPESPLAPDSLYIDTLTFK